MKVIYGIGKAKKLFKNTVLAIGVFDGLHVGHQELIKKAVKKAKSKKGEVVVMTFSPHPVKVLNPKAYMPYIVSLPYRLKLIENLGVAACVVVNFTKRFSQMSPQNFIKKYLVGQISPQEIIVGEDFRFGHDRSGSLDLFKEAGKKYGFTINAVQTVSAIKGKIGSTMIRKLIAEGDLTKAKKYLGRPVSLLGKVVKGDGRGKSLGYPTANIELDNEVLPPTGVYAVYVQLDKKRYKGMANLGVKPSFKKNKVVGVEVHIFNLRKSIYGKEVIVEFIKKIREELKFEGAAELVDQLKRDEIRVKKILK